VSPLRGEFDLDLGAEGAGAPAKLCLYRRVLQKFFAVLPEIHRLADLFQSLTPYGTITS